MLVSWSSNHQTSLNIPWKSTDQQDVHFHFYQIFPLVLYYTHTFSSPFHICLPRNSQRVRWAEGLLKTFLQKNPTSAPVYLWWGKVFSKHRLFQWFFNLPRNRSPARFLELALLCVLWIDTIFHTPPGVHRPKGKKITAFYTASLEMCFCPRCMRGQWPRKASHSLCTQTAWSFRAGNRQQQHCPGSCSSPHTTHTTVIPHLTTPQQW